MPNRLDYAFHTWWDTNYIAHVQKKKRAKKNASKSNMAQAIRHGLA